MSEVAATSEVKEILIEAVVTRADGTVEDLGVISRSEFDSDNQPWSLLDWLRSTVRNG